MTQMNAVDPAALARPKVKLKVLDPRLGTAFPLPAYATLGSAGLDMRAMIEQTLTLNPGDTALVPSGVSVYLENPNYMAVLVPRSGLGHKQGLVLSNGTGVIDSDYQAGIGIGLFNRGRDPIVIQPGDRVAQMVVVPVVQVEWELVDDFVETERGIGGFGSTGKS